MKYSMFKNVLPFIIFFVVILAFIYYQQMCEGFQTPADNTFWIIFGSIVGGILLVCIILMFRERSKVSPSFMILK